MLESGSWGHSVLQTPALVLLTLDTTTKFVIMTRGLAVYCVASETMNVPKLRCTNKPFQSNCQILMLQIVNVLKTLLLTHQL